MNMLNLYTAVSRKIVRKKSVKVRMITQRGIGNSFQFLDLRISGKSEKTLLYGQGHGHSRFDELLFQSLKIMD